jgi:peptidoglycan hydrolase-like amidase
MKNTYSLSLGWKGSQCNHPAMIRSKSRFDFWLSIIIVFLIIFVISQMVVSLDQFIRQPLADRDLSYLNPFHINSASAATVNESKFMVRSQTSIEVLPDSKNTIQIGFKNLGSKTWVKSGTGKVEIFLKRGSALLKRGELTTENNKSGAIGYFDLLINAASVKGNYTYKYVLARNGKEIIKGSEFTLKVKVTGIDKATIPATATTANVAVAAPAPAQVKMAEATQAVPAGRICLDYSIKKFLLNSDTQKIIDQCKKIGVDLAPNIWVEPNVTPTTSTPAPVPEPTSTPVPTLTPTPTPAPASTPTPGASYDSSYGPIIRVGLFSTIDSILMTANGNYKIVDQNKTVLATITAGMTTTVSFNFLTRTYTYNANGQTVATSSYLRLEPLNPGTVFEISSLYQIPTWNANLNFNKFLGALEVRYSPNTNKLWVINELQLEYYLKGLAETSNGSPIEYQKTMVTAARTYAMYHYNRGTKHAAEYYTVDATYDQVYRGYGSQLKQTQVGDAVEATKGQVVTYNGEVVVTPYFSYSDGRTRNWTEVWGGPAKPWCVSVKEPDNYDKTAMFGHGVGLSAHGALHLAYYYNYTYDNILKYYYTGIELKKIY